MSKFTEVNEKIAEKVVEGYKKIEDGVVSGYKKIEEGAVDGFNKVTDKCVEKLFAKDGESVEEAKKFAEDFKGEVDGKMVTVRKMQTLEKIFMNYYEEDENE